MKKTKVLCVLIAVLVLLVALAGCQQKVYSYSFTQELENVERVEIRKYDSKTTTTTPFVTLNDSDATSLLNDLTTIACYKQYGDYSRTSYSEIVIYISYKDSTAEVVGIHNTGRVDMNGEWWPSSYYFNGAAFRSLILKYVAAELVPELDKYVENS